MKQTLPLLVLSVWCANWAAAEYATKIHVGDDVELSLYTERMFRVRISALAGEKFPARYEIPFAIGHLENWPAVAFEHWQDDGFHYIETSAIRVRMATLCPQ